MCNYTLEGDPATKRTEMRFSNNPRWWLATISERPRELRRTTSRSILRNPFSFYPARYLSRRCERRAQLRTFLFFPFSHTLNKKKIVFGYHTNKGIVLHSYEIPHGNVSRRSQLRMKGWQFIPETRGESTIGWWSRFLSTDASFSFSIRCRIPVIRFVLLLLIASLSLAYWT